jgi:hypothetical protein
MRRTGRELARLRRELAWSMVRSEKSSAWRRWHRCFLMSRLNRLALHGQNGFRLASIF